MKTINMLRLWPPPRWPLIGKAKKIIREEGIEAFREWAGKLSQEETEALAAEVIDLLAEASGKSIQEVLRAIKKGSPPL